jgi:hypothetical protein
MTDKTNHVEKLEWIVEQLADSVLELSDEVILAEIRESGADPQEEAERTRRALQQAARPSKVEGKRLSKPGDTINPKYSRTSRGNL